MRKTKKALASLAIAGMVLSMAPMSVFGATTTTRLAGSDRITTAIAVAGQGWTTSDNVIVVPADDPNIVDALAAAPLAGQLNAPILVTYKGALDPTVQQEIVNLKAKNVYAIGALGTDTVASLKAISGVTVTALQGADRTETAAKVAAQLTNIKGSFVVAYNGTADAMSAASYAAANDYSILVENPDGTLPTSEAAYKGAKQYTVGGQAKLDGATALAGADRYATNDAVVNALTYKYDNVYVANGETLVDALAGAPLAAQTESPIVLANTAKPATGVDDNVTSSTQVIALGGVGVVPESVRLQVGHPTTGTFSVQSVKANAANSIKVVFGAAAADTSKVTFAVTRSTAPITVTTTWNDAKTEATLTYSSNFPEGDYTVNVKNDTTDLGTSNVTVTAQKVASINIKSTKLAVTSATTGSALGYASYNVLDQYGTDITPLSLANSIQFQTGVGTATGRDGSIKITPSDGINLLTFATVVITAYDSNSGVSTSATLNTSTQVGTLSTFQLTTLTNADGKTLTAGNSTDVFYAGYTATDVSGNPTTNYDLVKNGLILQSDGESLASANSYVTAKVLQDPNDSTKAVIEVKATDQTVQVDMPITITSMTWTGNNSTLNLTLKKAAAVDSITLMAPAYDIATGESKEIPFTAVDQNGVAVTKYSDLSEDVVTFNGAELSRNVDGTAVLKNKAQDYDGPLVITAMTKTGHYSTITIRIQKAAVADTLSVDSNGLVKAMQAGATQAIDFGYDKGGLTLKDQYGRAMDMTTYGDNNYEVQPSSSNPSFVTVAGTAKGGSNQITIKAVTPGSSTVKFNVVDTSTGTIIDTKSVALSVVKADDIKSYTIDTVANAIYAGTTGSAITDRDNAYSANPEVFGATSSGAKVVLAGSPITGAFVDNTTDFAIDTSSAAGTLGAYDSVYVNATKLPSTETSASTLLTVTLNGADGQPYTVTTPIKSSSIAPTAKDIAVYVSAQTEGISVNSAGDYVTVDLSKPAAAAAFANGKNLARFNAAGVKNRAGAYFYALDSYGTKGMKLAQIRRFDDTTLAGQLTAAQFNVTNDGTIVGTPTTGKVKLTGTTTNGLMKTIVIDFING